jgi:CRISPR system Cascade subunit CasA
VVALDAPRPDFNGALIQFLIGLVQTAWARADKYWDREDMLWSPPKQDELHALFLPMKGAFELDGDGPRFMQDLTLLPSDKPTENNVSALLIDFPGTQAIEHNTDHFVKQETGGALCPCCAATALFALMTNAPSGGAGHRTSLRGGGPLTTLIAYAQLADSQPAKALWRDVACNVSDYVSTSGARNQGRFNASDVFPWLRPINKLMRRAGEVQPLDVDPLQVFWAMPRRIRLDFATRGNGHCAVCAEANDTLVARYFTRNYGLNYKGPWRHPLSPYYRATQTEPFLPVHPQADGMTYRHWLGWAIGSKRNGREVVPAATVQAFHSTRVEPGQVRLWAFGYDMDNMKARCWYETTFPLFDLPSGKAKPPQVSEAIVSIVDPMIGAAESVATFVRLAVRDAWFGNGEARGDFGFVEASFWNRTEREFFQLVQQSITLAETLDRNAFDQSEQLRRQWLATLQRAALQLFDEVAATGSVEAGNPAKLAAAHRALRKRLYGDTLRGALALVSADVVRTAGRSRRARTKSNKAQEGR